MLADVTDASAYLIPGLVYDAADELFISAILVRSLTMVDPNITDDAD